MSWTFCAPVPGNEKLFPYGPFSADPKNRNANSATIQMMSVFQRCA